VQQADVYRKAVVSLHEVQSLVLLQLHGPLLLFLPRTGSGDDGERLTWL
jgi:hypothetical protein